MTWKKTSFQRERISKSAFYAKILLDKSAPKTNSIAIDAKNTWPIWAIHDAGLLHATLATWAIYGVLAKGLSELHCCHLKHKSDAINAISSKLTEPDGVVSDEVIGTVLTLASFEVGLHLQFWLLRIC